MLTNTHREPKPLLSFTEFVSFERRKVMERSIAGEFLTAMRISDRIGGSQLDVSFNLNYA